MRNLVLYNVEEDDISKRFIVKECKEDIKSLHLINLQGQTKISKIKKKSPSPAQKNCRNINGKTWAQSPWSSGILEQTRANRP